MSRLNNLRLRLVLWTVTLEFLLLLIFGVLLVIVIQNTQNQQLAESLKLGASQLNAVIDIKDNHFQISNEDREILTSEGILAWILDPNGNIVLTLGSTDTTPISSLSSQNDSLTNGHLNNGEPLRIFTSTLSEGSHQLGRLIVAKSLRESQTLIQEVTLGLIIAVPIVVLLSGAGGLFLANRALSPVATITHTAQQISTEDLSRRLSLKLPNDEIGELARTFDAMLDRLERGFVRERQLTADVSHELRTPLGMLKTQLSLARSRPRDVDTLLTMMADMEGDVDRMTRLTEQMLILTRVEQEGLMDLQPLDLAELLENVIEAWQAKAGECGVQLSLELNPSENLMIKGDADRLYQVFSNLIDNGIKYTSTHSTVSIKVLRREKDIQVTVKDRGAGIAPEYLPHVFERFYRADSARARTSGGFGLGLAITQAIVQAHYGHIEVTSQLGKGTTFTVTLPLYMLV